MNWKEPKSAFTLAEILITLGIIGVVAALTIPTLIQNADERATISALKKAYSTLSNAYTLAVQENGTPDNWGLTANPSPPVLDKLKPFLNVTKDCTDGSTGCWPAGVAYRYLAASLGAYGTLDSQVAPKLKLSDGTLLWGMVDSTSCIAQNGSSPALQHICARYDVDINGYKKPNQFGKDLFRFYLTKYGIIPWGTSKATSSTFLSSCMDKDTANGLGCAAWVIYNENMDYLHCNNLSWQSPTSCN